MAWRSRANADGLDADALVVQLGAWAAGRGALYRQLAAGLERLVHDGVVRHGERLPPERVLAAELAVARGTVVAAYDQLRADGIVERIQGSGTRVVAGARGVPAALSSSGDELFSALPATIDLLKAVPPVNDAVRQAVIEADLGRFPAAWTTVEPAGLPELRAKIADRYTAGGFPTTPAEILVTSGAQQAIALVMARMLSPGDVVLAEELTWPGFSDTVRRAGGRLHGVAMDDQGIDVDALAASLARLRPSMVVLNPHHHNPTGTRLSSARRRRVAELAAEHGVALVEDRVAAPLAFDGVVPPPLASLEPNATAFTIDSLSKSVWAGLRIGWVRSDAATIHSLRGAKALNDLWSSVPSQVLAVTLLDHVDESTRSTIETLRRSARILSESLSSRLPDWEVSPVRGGMVAWAHLPSGSAGAFARFAVRHGVAVATSREFSTTIPHDDHVRIPFTSADGVLVEAVDRLAAAWEAFPNLPLDEPVEHVAIV